MNNPFSKLALCLLLIGIATSLGKENIVIGIYTQIYNYGDHNPINDKAKLTYILTTYVNLATMSGAKVVPIYSYSSKETILSQLSKVNGVIFTGGQEYISMKNIWAQHAKVILDYAKTQNDQGKVFPILGICQGLELMLYLTSNLREDFLDKIQGQNGVWNTVDFKSTDYYILNGLSNNTFKALTDHSYSAQKGVAYFFHSNGTLMPTFQNDADLSNFWDIKGTTTQGSQQIVTYLQAKNYPFYIVQFHPERLSYQSNFSNQLFQSRIQIVHKISFNFVVKCRQSRHTYPKSQLQNDIIDSSGLSDSTRFPEVKVYLFNQYANSNDNQNPNDHTWLIVIMSAIAAVIVLILSVYGWRKYKGTKNSQQNQTQKLNQQNLGYEAQFKSLNQNQSNRSNRLSLK